MRLWSLHPRHLDTRALVACWREGLLAYHVLRGMTKGYTNHPQLIRFRATENPILAMEIFLHSICDEADIRGYHFDRTKLGVIGSENIMIPLHRGQLRFEQEHLYKKILQRAPKEFFRLDGEILSHPMFHLIDGEVEIWEKV